MTNLMNENYAHYLSFRVGDQWCGVDVSNVQEVLLFVRLSEPPMQEDKILGLLHIHEKIVPVIDLRIAMGIAAPKYALNTPIVMLNGKNGVFGAVVDEVDDVKQVNKRQQAAYDGPTLRGVYGMVKLPEHLLILLDTDYLSQIGSQTTM